MIGILYDTRHTVRPVFALTFLVLCVLVTVPSLLVTGLYDVFGSAGEREHAWQVLTSVFEHGFPGFPGYLHLAVTVFFILECGRPCERLLGTPRFALLSFAALGANALAQFMTRGVNGTEGVQGASLVILAWGPTLFIALLHARRSSPSARYQPEYGRLCITLILMYGVVPFLTPILPYSAGWEGSFIHALVLANLYHMVATAVGLAFAAHWFLEIRKGLEDVAFVVQSKDAPKPKLTAGS